MDVAWASPILTSVQSGARMLISGTTEPFSLVLWGCGLLAVSAAARAVLSPERRVVHSDPSAEVRYASEHRPLTQTRA